MNYKLFALVLLFVVLTPGVLAVELEDLEDAQIFGLEVEKLLYFLGGLLAACLSVVSFVSMQRTNNNKLGYVSIAFGLWAIRGLMIGSELFLPELSYADPLSAALDFAIMLCFVVGVMKK